MRYDRRDPDAQALRLTRAGHYLWFQLKNANLASTVMQQRPLYEALEIIWEAKRQVKAEIAAKNAERFKGWQSRVAA
jgi:hypothetical protein